MSLVIAALALLLGSAGLSAWLVLRNAPAAESTTAAAASEASARGLVQIDASPWAQVEVDGIVVGTAPPLTQLALPKSGRTRDAAPWRTRSSQR